MKKAILSIGLFVCVAIGANAQETATPNPVNPNAPKFKFETEVVDYGTIEHNANGDREFKFTNVGKEPLIISNAVGSCGCTTPQWPKEPIAPGAKGTITVKYDTKKVGAINKSVTITSNAVNEPSKTIRIKGNVAAPAEGASPVNNSGAPSNN